MRSAAEPTPGRLPAHPSRLGLTPASRTGGPLERLHDEHTQIEELFDAFARHQREPAWHTGEAQRLADLICTLLRVHDELEATVLEPALLRALGPHSALDHARHERVALAQALEEVESLSARDPGFAAAVARLAHHTRLRFQHDESELFELARQAPLDMAALDREMGAHQERLLSAGRSAT